MAGGRPQFFLPAVCGAVTISPRSFVETSNYPYRPRCSTVTRCRGVPLALHDAETRTVETLPWQMANDIWHRVGVQLPSITRRKCRGYSPIMTNQVAEPMGANRSGLSLRTLPTRRSTGQNAMAAAGIGPEHGLERGVVYRWFRRAMRWPRRPAAAGLAYGRAMAQEVRWLLVVMMAKDLSVVPSGRAPAVPQPGEGHQEHDCRAPQRRVVCRLRATRNNRRRRRGSGGRLAKPTRKAGRLSTLSARALKVEWPILRDSVSGRAQDGMSPQRIAVSVRWPLVETTTGSFDVGAAFQRGR